MFNKCLHHTILAKVNYKITGIICHFKIYIYIYIIIDIFTENILKVI